MPQQDHTSHGNDEELRAMHARALSAGSAAERARLQFHLALRYSELGEFTRSQEHMIAFHQIARDVPGSVFFQGKTHSESGPARSFEPDYQPLTQRLLERSAAFTPTELNVALLLARNHSSKEIAFRLGISAATVDLYRTRIRKKLGLAHGDNLVVSLHQLRGGNS